MPDEQKNGKGDSKKAEEVRDKETQPETPPHPGEKNGQKK